MGPYNGHDPVMAWAKRARKNLDVVAVLTLMCFSRVGECQNI